MRDDFGKLPIEYAMALPEVDFELLDLLDPEQAAKAPSVRLAPASRKASAATGRPRRQARRAASEPRLKKPAAKLPTVMENELLEPSTAPNQRTWTQAGGRVQTMACLICLARLVSRDRCRMEATILVNYWHERCAMIDKTAAGPTLECACHRILDAAV